MNRNVFVSRVSLMLGLLLAVSVVGSCKKGKESDALPGNFPSGVYFAYPYNGQNDVPAGSQVVVKFANTLPDAQLSGGVGSKKLELVDNEGKSIQTVMARRPGNDSIVEFKTEGLQAGKTYGISARGISGVATGAAADILSFTVRKRDVLPGVAPAVVSRNPDPAKGYSYMDFSTLRILFTESLETASVIKGESFKFLNASGAQVAGTLIMRGRYLTFDPASDLRAGEKYTVVLTRDIKDKSGETLDKSYRYEIIPRSPGRKVAQVLKATPDYESGSGKKLSSLVGSEVNTIGLTSHLLEQETIRLKASLFAEMGEAALFPNSLPFVIRKGNFLTASAVEFKLGGAIQANINTGELHMALISDATGYIVGNPYSDEPGAPAYVVLIMDISVTAQGTVANSAMTQDVMHVEAVGAVSVEGERLVINAVGSIELSLLGLEKATGNLVLRLETPTVAPRRVVDTTAPTVAAVFPENGDATFGRDVMPIVMFSEPLDVDSVVAGDNIKLIDAGDGSELDFTIEISGASVLLAPTNILASGRTYQVEVGPGIRDLSGNELGKTVSNSFSTVFVSTDWAMPISMLSLYPGMPCALTDGNWKSGGSKAGRCVGGESGDDNIDVPMLPANRPIKAYFSQSLDQNTVMLSVDACAKDNSISVQELDKDGACVGTVKGTLHKKDRSFSFLPREGWIVGKRYALIIHSGSNESCNAGELCSEAGKPLNTDVLNRKEWNHDGKFLTMKRYRPEAGGPDIEMPFDVVERTTDVLLTLSSLPSTDNNGNGVVDGGEIAHRGNYANVLVDGVDGLLIHSSKILGEQGIFLNKRMLVSIGKYEKATDQIPVTVYSQHIQGTNLKLENDGPTASCGFLNPLCYLRNIPAPTYMSLMRIRNKPMGAIYRGPEGPRFSLKLKIYFDAPYLRVLENKPLIFHDLQSKKLTVELDGPVTFKQDGRMEITLESIKAAYVKANVRALELLTGYINLEIPVGGMKLHVIGDAPKNVFKDARF